MKHGFVRTMGFLMAAVLLLAMVLPAQVATTGKSGRFSYSMKGNGTLKITAFDWDGYEDDTDIVIPQMIDGFTVTEIGSLAFSQGDMDYERVELPFYEHYAWNATLIIPNTVTTVGEKAFFNTSIGIVNIPASVEYIGAAAFCTMSLKRVTVDPSNKNYASIDGSLYSKKDKELLALGSETSKVPNGIISLGEFSCVQNDENKYFLYSINKVLPCDTIEIIKDFAFYDNRFFSIDSGEKISPYGEGSKGGRILEWKNVKRVGKYAFARTKSLFSMNDIYTLRFTNKLETIGEGCFYGAKVYCILNDCRQLTIIPERAFEGGEVSLYLPDSIEKIDNRAFAGAELRVNNDAKLKIIGDQVFYKAMIRGWVKTGINIYDSTTMDYSEGGFLGNVESIGSEAFYETNIETVAIPASCVYIGDNAFDKVSVKLKVQPGSYAERWAQDNGCTYDNGIKADTSWLN